MIRSQVQLSPGQVRKVRAVARRDGVSVAEVIRRCIDLALRDDTGEIAERYSRAARLIGAFTDAAGKTDLATKHDDYLDEAYE